MSLETDVQGLTQATTNLLEAVNTSKATLDQAVDDAAAQVALATTQATSAAASAATATTKASDAAGSAASALAIYGNTAAQQAAVTAAQNAASVAAGHAASASSVVQQDLSGVNAAALHRSPNAVTAMFVYDTSKDSDGGAWTEKCQHTSWYNEAINGKWLGAQASEAAARAVSGATTGDYFQLTTDGKFYKLNATSGTTEVFRGNKRDFPRLAAIVAEAANVTIYDLTEPGRPMWVRFVGNWAGPIGAANMLIALSGNPLTSIAAMNGLVAVAANNNTNLPFVLIDFLKDGATGKNAGVSYTYKGNIAQRNAARSYSEASGEGIAGFYGNAVAMTVLPGAPVDPVTGLQVPTIAVGTSGGLSIIRHNGTVYNITSNPSVVNFLSISGKTLYISGSFGSQSSFGFIKDIGAASPVNYFVSTGQDYGGYLAFNGYGGVRNTAAKGVVAVAAPIAYAGAPYALAFQKTNFSFPDGTSGKAAQGVFAKLTNSWNKGYSVGDERRAYLCDIDAGSVSGTELVTNGTFDTDLSGWTNTSTGTGSATYSGGAAALVGTDASNRGMLTQQVSVTAGKVYRVTYTVSRTSGAMGAGFVASQGTVPTTTYETASGTFSYLLTAPANNCYFAATTHAGGGNVSIDNISIKEVVVDRSYKAQGASITGALTKTAVASAAQLVAYSGFSASNYLREPYSADLDFGTGEWSASAWVNVPVTLPDASFPSVGPELVTNGTFDTDANWTRVGTGGTVAISGGVASVTNVAGSFEIIGYSQNIPVVSGKTYFVTASFTKSSANGAARISFGPLATFNGLGTSGTISGYVTATASTFTLLAHNPGNGSEAITVTFDNISIKEAGVSMIADRAHSSGAKLNLGVTPFGNLQATAYDGTTTRTVTTTATYNTATWLKVRANYTTDGSLALLVNGQEVAVTRGAPLLTLNNANAVLTIGNSYAADAPFPGSLALVKFSATVPTAEQSVWMYEQEKQLFRDGAQCCLPDSGSIVDLTYDDAADKWIAVSATNESEWSGLVRTSVTAVPAGSYTKAAAASGVQLLARSTTSPGVDITIPAYGLREELVKRAESAARLARIPVPFDYVGGFTASTTNGSTSITSVAGLSYPTSYIGARVTGSGIPADTVVTAVSGTTIYLSKAATATATGVQISFTDFILPVGYEAKAVLSAGSVKTEGSTKDYTRLFDGFRESIRFGTAPGYQAAVQIQATRSAA